MYGNVGLEMNGVMSSDSYIGTGKAPGNDDEVSNTDDSTSISGAISYPTSMNAADNLSNYPGFTNAMYFNGSDDYLSRVFGSPTDGTKYTISVWVKRSSVSSDQFIAGHLVDPYYDSGINFNSSDNLIIGDHNAGKITTSGVFKDTSSWYHIVSQRNSADGKLVLWVNGVKQQEISVTGATSWNAQGANDADSKNYIGAMYYQGMKYKFHGYLANIQFIDGQALDATDLGQYMVDSNGNTTSAWVPKLYDGDYGQNGFLLDFSSLELNSSGEIIQVNDTAPKTDGQSQNNWTAN
jgi:hypothetical protein